MGESRSGEAGQSGSQARPCDPGQASHSGPQSPGPEGTVLRLSGAAVCRILAGEGGLSSGPPIGHLKVLLSGHSLCEDPSRWGSRTGTTAEGPGRRGVTHQSRPPISSSSRPSSSSLPFSLPLAPSPFLPSILISLEPSVPGAAATLLGIAATLGRPQGPRAAPPRRSLRSSSPSSGIVGGPGAALALGPGGAEDSVYLIPVCVCVGVGGGLGKQPLAAGRRCWRPGWRQRPLRPAYLLSAPTSPVLNR